MSDRTDPKPVNGKEAWLRLHRDVCRLGLEIAEALPMPRWWKNAARDRLTNVIASDVLAIEEERARWTR